MKINVPLKQDANIVYYKLTINFKYSDLGNTVGYSIFTGMNPTVDTNRVPLFPTGEWTKSWNNDIGFTCYTISGTRTTAYSGDTLYLYYITSINSGWYYLGNLTLDLRDQYFEFSS